MNTARIGRKHEDKATSWIRANGYQILNEDDRNPGRFGEWPDRLAIDEEGNLHFFEVKTGGHTLDPHQERVLKALNRCGTVHILKYDTQGRFIGDQTFQGTL